MKRIVALLFFILLYTGLFAQRSIVLTNPKGEDQWIISEGDRMKFEMRGDFHGTYKGRVTEVKDSSFVVRGVEYKFSKVKSIKLSKAPARRSIILGLVLGGIGVATAPVNESLGSPVPAEMLLPGQIVFIGGGAFFFIRGIIELASNHKFKLYEGWSMRSVPLAKLKEERG